MVLLGNNVLLAEAPKDKLTAGGIILTGGNSKASKPALILEIGDSVPIHVKPSRKAYIDWSEALPVEYKGIPAAIVPATAIKAVFD
jgi:co-chaperonin GroES (HSP10)